MACNSIPNANGRREGAADGDSAAQRILNLLFILYSAPRPLTTEEIVSDSDLGYGSPSRDADMRKFRRDRAKLAAMGVVVQEVHPEGSLETEQSAWTIDRERTFAAGGIISIDDIDLITQAIDNYLAVPGNPLANPLRRLRTKALQARAIAIGGTGSLAGGAVAPHVPANPLLDAVWWAFAERVRLDITYTDAGGSTSTRRVAIYGLFSHDGASYFTGLDDKTGEVRTFRVDRVERAKKTRSTYVIPEDFDIADYVFMPYDFSRRASTPCTFSMPGTLAADEVAAITRGRGVTSQEDDRWIWRVDMRDVRAGAAYALGRARDGIKPVAPRELVACWNSLIESAVAMHEK